MKGKNRNFEKMVIFAMVAMMYLSALTVLSTPSSDELGEQEEVELIIMDSPPTPPLDVSDRIVDVFPLGITILGNVPTSRWTQGCSATSAGMIFGYYDRTTFPNMYTGPCNGGVCPLSELGQGKPGDAGYPFAGSCSIIATCNGFDGRVTKGHTDDYWIAYTSPGPDPWVGNWAEHAWADCTADFMGTNQWKWDYIPYPAGDGSIEFNTDGSTCLWMPSGAGKLYDFIPAAGCGLPQTSLAHGMRLFVESRGYKLDFSGGNFQVYTQKTENKVGPTGFTFADFKNEIDNGYPVMVQVTGHSMVGLGYDDTVTPPLIYIHDTWGNYVATMQWGNTWQYSGMDLEAITVIHLDDLPTAAYTWWDGDGGGTGTKIYFNAGASSDDNGIASYDWDWTDDGSYDYTTGSIANHDYGDCLTHNCKLRVTDTQGQTDTVTYTVQATGCVANLPPVLSNEIPLHTTTGVLITTSSLSVDINDPEDNSFDWTIETVPNIGSNSGTGETDGTKTCSISGLNYSMTYTWYVNATDSLPGGSGTYTRAVYTFTTEFETEPPEITNVDAQPDPQVAGGSVNVTCNVTDNVAVNVVKVNVTDPNGSSVNVTIFEGSYYYNTTYTIVGTYNYFIWANDTSNNINTSTAYQFEVVSGTITVDIPLDTGWNLITVPIENSFTAMTLSENITNSIMISRFDAKNQTYKTYIVGGPPGFDFPIQDGYGYFVLVSDNSYLNVSGDTITSVSVDLEIGWNMIGWYHSYNTMASSLGENITGCQMVSWFDRVSQTFKTYIVGGPPGFDFTITSGMGLFVLVDTASVWHGEG